MKLFTQLLPVPYPVRCMPAERVGALSERAVETLEFIRATMARSAAFTAVPGRGGMVMGGIALLAAWTSARQESWRAWLAVWLVAAVVASATGVEAIRRKSRAAGMPLWSETGRRFAQAFVPALAAGAVLTIGAVLDGREDRLPATWLLLYGAGIVAGASTSIPILTALGVAIMSLGFVAAMLPAWWGTVCLAAGFGGLQIIFGFIIARKHGG
jgi:hypothetical protein